MTTRIPVGGSAPYEVVVGHGLLGELPPLLGKATRVAVIHPPTLRATAEGVRDDLIATGLDAHAIEIPDGEDAKTVQVAGSTVPTFQRRARSAVGPVPVTWRRTRSCVPAV